MKQGMIMQYILLYRRGNAADSEYNYGARRPQGAFKPELRRRFCASVTRYSISPEVERGGLLLNKTFCGSGKHKEDTSRAFYTAVWHRLV